jgi:hypothetical protein
VGVQSIVVGVDAHSCDCAGIDRTSISTSLACCRSFSRSVVQSPRRRLLAYLYRFSCSCVSCSKIHSCGGAGINRTCSFGSLLHFAAGLLSLLRTLRRFVVSFIPLMHRLLLRTLIRFTPALCSRASFTSIADGHHDAVGCVAMYQ